MGNYFGDRSDGDNVTISTNLVYPSTVDGDMVVKQYGNLTIDEHVFVSTQTRCRGLMIFVDGNLTLKPYSSISMVKKGCVCIPNAGEQAGHIKLIDLTNCTITSDFKRPKYLFDNKRNTHTYKKGSSGYVIIDLLSSRRIYGFNITGSYTYGFSRGGTDPRTVTLDLKVSDNGTSWTTVGSQTFTDERNVSKLFSPSSNDLSFWNKRYFQVVVTDNTGGNNYVYLQEIEVFAHEDDSNNYWDIITEVPPSDGYGVEGKGLVIPFETGNHTDTLQSPNFKGTGNKAKDTIDFFSSNTGKIGYNVIIDSVGAPGSALPDRGQHIGNPGYNSDTSSGGGGSGSGGSGTGGVGVHGTCFSGGAGGGGGSGNNVLGDIARPYGGQGGKGQWRDSGSADGGTGNPGGDVQGGGDWNGHGNTGLEGTGGLLILIVRGDVNIQHGARLDTSGTYDNRSHILGLGGSSGGGPLILAHGGNLINDGLIKTQSDTFTSSNGHGGGQGGAGAQILLPITAASTQNDIILYKYGGIHNTQGELQCVIFYDKNDDIGKSVTKYQEVDGVYLPFTILDNWASLNVASIVPPNSVMEVLVLSSNPTSSPDHRRGGVREVGSTLDRVLDIHSQQVGCHSPQHAFGEKMYVNVDNHGNIEYYAQSSENDATSTTIQFKVIGYWTGVTFKEDYKLLTVSSVNTWEEKEISTEIINGVGHFIIQRFGTIHGITHAGVRNINSTEDRIVITSPSNTDGVSTVSMLANILSSKVDIKVQDANVLYTGAFIDGVIFTETNIHKSLNQVDGFYLFNLPSGYNVADFIISVGYANGCGIMPTYQFRHRYQELCTSTLSDEYPYAISMSSNIINDAVGYWLKNTGQQDDYVACMGYFNYE